MQIRAAALVVASVTLPVILVVGSYACSSTSKVTSATCNACSGRAYTADSCNMLGQAAGCAHSALLPNGSGGCINGCSFDDCAEAPDCLAINLPAEAASDVMDEPLDPTCKAALSDTVGRGLFAAMPTCADAGTVNINGATRYTCPCGGACPCNYQCGSIALSVGGTIGSVCAPQ
jgi:hypothetical protein